MVPIRPVEMGLELLFDEIRTATWKERFSFLRFVLWEVPLIILSETIDIVRERAERRKV